MERRAQKGKTTNRTHTTAASSMAKHNLSFLENSSLGLGTTSTSRTSGCARQGSFTRTKQYRSVLIPWPVLFRPAPESTSPGLTLSLTHIVALPQSATDWEVHWRTWGTWGYMSSVALFDFGKKECCVNSYRKSNDGAAIKHWRKGPVENAMWRK